MGRQLVDTVVRLRSLRPCTKKSSPRIDPWHAVMPVHSVPIVSVPARDCADSTRRRLRRYRSFGFVFFVDSAWALFAPQMQRVVGTPRSGSVACAVPGDSRFAARLCCSPCLSHSDLSTASSRSLLQRRKDPLRLVRPPESRWPTLKGLSATANEARCRGLPSACCDFFPPSAACPEEEEVTEEKRASPLFSAAPLSERRARSRRPDDVDGRRRTGSSPPRPAPASVVERGDEKKKVEWREKPSSASPQTSPAGHAR